MEIIHYSPETARLFPGRPVVTIGTFDGVHRGHRAILSGLAQEAHERRETSVVLTFEPHPQWVIRARGPLYLLTLLEEKKALLEAAGIDVMLVVPFTDALSKLTYQQFIEQYLHAELHAGMLVIGYNQALGHDRMGRGEVLLDALSDCSIDYRLIEPVTLGTQQISSSRIRKTLESGHSEGVALANTMLGYNYTMCGVVVHGDGNGRKIGFPTANLDISADKLIPAHGVYLASARMLGSARELFGVVNVGVRPTFQRAVPKQVVEMHIFAFDHDVYGHMMHLSLLEYIRPEQAFSSVDDLTRQIAQDIDTAKAMLSGR